MNLGKKVKLVGKSRHGKNRVREQGELWQVVNEKSNINFRTNAPGPFLLIQSESSDNIRWVSIHGDPDFVVEIL